MHTQLEKYWIFCFRVFLASPSVYGFHTKASYKNAAQNSTHHPTHKQRSNRYLSLSSVISHQRIDACCFDSVDNEYVNQRKQQNPGLLAPKIKILRFSLLCFPPRIGALTSIQLLGFAGSGYCHQPLTHSAFGQLSWKKYQSIGETQRVATSFVPSARLFTTVTTSRRYTSPSRSSSQNSISTDNSNTKLFVDTAAMSTATNQESDDIRQQKKDLRKKVKADLKLLTVEDIQSQSRQVWDKLIALPEYQSAKTVGVFLSMPRGEINTDFMLQHAHDNGKTLYIPEVGQNFEQSNMELVKVIVNSDTADKSKPVHYNWPRNKWGIPEPPSEMPRELAQPGDIDVLIVPGVAFDSQGRRIGHGKGYYDRFIARMRQKNDSKSGSLEPVLIAVGMKPSFVDTVPVSANDFMMDRLIFPNEMFTFERTV